MTTKANNVQPMTLENFERTALLASELVTECSYRNVVNRTLSLDTLKRIKTVVQQSVKSENAGNAATDGFIADGFTVITDFVSPTKADSTCTPEEWNGFKLAIVQGFSEEVRTLLATPTKSLENQVMKDSKRKWQQQINARIADFKLSLKRRIARENPEAAKAESEAKKKTSDQRVRDALNDVIKVCSTKDDMTFDVSNMALKVRAALAILEG